MSAAVSRFTSPTPGPADGAPVMLVHGFPQDWWEWHELIGPLACDRYRVLCPDLPGAGWSSAPRDRYLKADMAADLAAALDRLGVGQVRLVAHDCGGPVAIIMMLRHPESVGLFRAEHHRTVGHASMMPRKRFSASRRVGTPRIGSVEPSVACKLAGSFAKFCRVCKSNCCTSTVRFTPPAALAPR